MKVKNSYVMTEIKNTNPILSESDYGGILTFGRIQYSLLNSLFEIVKVKETGYLLSVKKLGLI